MKKFSSIFVMSALFTLPVLAQTDIPMATEIVDGQKQSVPDYPNLGRRSTPLSSLVLTPPPLPPIEIELGTKKRTAQTEPVQPVPTQPQEEPQASQTPSTPSKPIELNKDIPVSKSKPAPKPTLEKKVKQVPLPKFEKKVARNVMPTDINDLFDQSANVKNFHLSGIGLGMTPEDVIDTAIDSGWKIALQKSAIPLFRESLYEQKCRHQGKRIVREINNCIEQSAKEDEVFYVNEIVLKRPQTRETMSVLFTSNATDNVVYKIFYQSLGDNSLGFSPKNMAAKLRRKEMFWNQMFAAFGYPDDADLILWGDLQKAYMQATISGSNYDAYVSIEDKQIQDKDYFAAEDAAKEFQYPNPFTLFSNDE